MARKPNPALANIARFKANIAARDKNRLAVRPQAGPDPFANIGELGAGALRVGRNVADYAVRSSPQQVGSDAVRMAKNVYDAVAADPVKFGLESLVDGPVELVNFVQARDDAKNLRAAGNPAAAKKLEEQAATMLLMAIPVVGAAGKAAGKVKSALSEGERLAAKGTSLAVKGAEDVATTGAETAVSATKKGAKSLAVKPPKKPAAQTGILATPDLRVMKTAEAVAATEGDPHIISGANGYVGAPAGVSTPEDLAVMRGNFDKDVALGAEGSNWYDRARDFNTLIAGPNPTRQRLAAQEEALFSAQAAPDSNFGTMLNAHNAYEAGKPLDIARTGQQAETYRKGRDAMSPVVGDMGHNGGPPLDDIMPEISLGPKTGIYGKHLDPTSPFATTGTNDIWHARGFGYTNTGGEQFSRALTPQEHRFLDYETMKAVKRANDQQLGGRTNWTAAEIQAAPWVAGKGRALATTKFHSKEARDAAKAAGVELPLTDEQMAWGVDQASKTYPDYGDKYTAFATYETTPGPNTGHLTGITDMPYDVREKYAQDPRSTWAKDDRDILYDALGMYQLPTQEALGAFKPAGSTVTEFNPLRVARPLVGMAEGDLAPASRALMNSAEALRGAVSGQEASAWHKPILNADTSELGSISAPTAGKLTEAQYNALTALGAKHGLPDVIDTGQGATLTAFYPNNPPTGTATGAALKKGLASDIRNILPDSNPARAKVVSDYLDYADEWKKGAGSGAVTSKMLDYLNDPEAPSALAKLDTPEIRAHALGEMQRDAEFAQRTGVPVREDLQNMRRIIAERGVGALRDALSKGEFLPALAATLGLGAAVGSANSDDNSGL